MRIAHSLAGTVAVIAAPLLLTGASYAPTTTASTVPNRCYGGAIYEFISGYPTAHELFDAQLRQSQYVLNDLHQRAPQLTDDPYLSGTLARTQGQVEAFTALLKEAPPGARPAFDLPVRALDEDGQLIAEVTFSSWIAAEQGTYAINGATLPNPGADPAHGCRSWGEASDTTTS